MRYVLFSIACVLFLMACRGAEREVDENPIIKIPHRGDLEVLDPVVHENLAVYFVRSSMRNHQMTFLTLAEGLEQHLVSITEKGIQGDPKKVLVRNHSLNPLYIQAGTMIRGGMQDRVFSADMLLPPEMKKPLPVPVLSIERGRWMLQEGEHHGFTLSPYLIPTHELFCAVQIERGQSSIWKEMESLSIRLRKRFQDMQKNPTAAFLFTLSDQRIASEVQAYVDRLFRLPEKGDDYIGAVFVINGQVSAIHLYQSSILFPRMYPTLLRSFALEATIRKGSKPVSLPLKSLLQVMLRTNMKNRAESFEKHLSSELFTRKSEGCMMGGIKTGDSVIHEWGIIDRLTEKEGNVDHEDNGH